MQLTAAAVTPRAAAADADVMQIDAGV